jgi:hypothetical protein
MRLVNRPLAFILAAALIAVCIVIIAEVIGFAAHRSPLLVHWSTWYHWGLKTRWDVLAVRVWSAILIVVGALILALELKPRRVTRDLRGERQGPPPPRKRHRGIRRSRPDCRGVAGAAGLPRRRRGQGPGHR